MIRIKWAVRGLAGAVSAVGLYVFARRWRRSERPMTRAERKAARKAAVERAMAARR